MATLKQYSTIASLSAGNYDGQFKYADILPGNDFGVSTYDALDGETVGVDGEWFHLKGDGTVGPLDMESKTPFGSFTKWEATKRPVILMGSINKSSLYNIIEASIEPEKTYAIKVTARFLEVKTKSVIKQEKPYKPLAKIFRPMPTHFEEPESGYLIGFYTPEELANIGIEGLHLHYLNEAKNKGGHLVDFTADTGVIEFCELDKIELNAGTYVGTQALTWETIKKIDK